MSRSIGGLLKVLGIGAFSVALLAGMHLVYQRTEALESAEHARRLQEAYLASPEGCFERYRQAVADADFTGMKAYASTYVVALKRWEWLHSFRGCAQTAKTARDAKRHHKEEEDAYRSRYGINWCYQNLDESHIIVKDGLDVRRGDYRRGWWLVKMPSGWVVDDLVMDDWNRQPGSARPPHLQLHYIESYLKQPIDQVFYPERREAPVVLYRWRDQSELRALRALSWPA